MKMRTSFVWFVEPIGKNHDQTNKIISELLPAENAISDVKCVDRKEHNLWRCTSWESVGKLDSCSGGMGLRFKVWVQRGRNAAIRPFPFRRNSANSKVLLEHVAD